MEILFCDICNESVPAPDLALGKAIRRGERVVCAACDGAMSTHRTDPLPAGSPATPGGAGEAHGAASNRAGAAAATRGEVVLVARGGGAMGAIVGLVAVVFTAVGFALLLERLDGLQADQGAARAELREELGRLQERQARLLDQVDERVLAAEGRSAEEREALRVELAALLDGVRTELAAHGERGDVLAQGLSALTAELERRDQVAGDALADLGRQVIDLEGDIRFYSDRVVELEETLRLLSSRPVAFSGGPGAGAPGDTPGDTTPPWQGLVTDLGHANPGIRLDAVYALGETRDQRVVPHLVPMLKDEDLFVRMATARVLMDLDARLAVPDLIDALEDTSSAVREAAMVALRQITGQDFGFEPLASDGERAKRVKSWRDWWKKSGDDFLTSS